MKKISKALCHVLCITMLLGMTAANVYAANFTDEESIVNSKAVNVLTDLNIIQGKDDGSFDPAGNVTRAELCKMISIALNGGKDPLFGATVSSYSDVGDHWAAGYIEYCSNLGIIAGRGDDTFDPDGNVTGSQAVKMLLVTIGYDAETENMVGTDWAIAANIRANQKDLYEGLNSIDPSVAITRDQAAQLIYNTCNAVMVEYEYKLFKDANGDLQAIAVIKDDADGETIFSSKFNIIP